MARGDGQSRRAWIRRFEAALDADPTLEATAFLRAHRDAPPELATALGVIGALRRTSDDEVPARLGSYEIGRILGRGAQGTVYEERDTQLGRRVALKVLRPPQGRTGEFFLRFQREAEAAGRFEHAHVCTVYGAGIEEGHPYIAMQFVEGPDLAEHLQVRDAGTRTRLAVLGKERLAAAAEGMQRAHASLAAIPDIGAELAGTWASQTPKVTVTFALRDGALSFLWQAEGHADREGRCMARGRSIWLDMKATPGFAGEPASKGDTVEVRILARTADTLEVVLGDVPEARGTSLRLVRRR